MANKWFKTDFEKNLKIEKKENGEINMWFIFLIACIVVALAALIVIWIGSKVFHSIDKQERKNELEQEINEKVKKDLKEKP